MSLGLSSLGLLPLGSVDAVSGGSSVSLAIADCTHAHAADNLALSSSTALIVADAAHAHIVDGVTLTTNWLLVVADAAHAHLADNVALDTSDATALVISNALHAHAADSLGLTLSTWLAIAEAAHGHTADSPTLSTQSALQIADALHAMYSDVIVFPSDLTDSEKIDLILDILANRQTLNPATGLFTLYADDGVTVLRTAQAWEDAAGTIAYRGQGLRRLDALQ